MESPEEYVTTTAVEIVKPPEAGPLVLRPVRHVQDFIDQRAAIVDIIKKAMKPDVHYGKLPGTKSNMLYKPGAEMLLQTFGLTCPDPIAEKIVEDWDGSEHGGEPFFYYRFKSTVYYGDRPVASAVGICNSHEDKYRYRWVPRHEIPDGIDPDHCEKRVGKVVEFAFAVRKAETTGKYAKPAEYWQAFRDAMAAKTERYVKKSMGAKGEQEAIEIDTTVYKIANPNIADEAHTISAMAQKRAMVAATRIATCASEYFTGGDKVEKDEGQPGLTSEFDKQHVEKEEKQRDRAENGTTPDPDKPAADVTDLYPKAPARRPVKLDVASDICKRYGQAPKTAKDGPAADFGAALETRLKGLGLDPEALARKVFERAFTGLTAAHIDAINAATDDDLKSIIGANDSVAGK
jgi:hypothetical protein